MCKRVEPIRGLEDFPPMGQPPRLIDQKEDKDDTEYRDAHGGRRMDPYPRKDACQHGSRKHHPFVQEAKENYTEEDPWNASPTPYNQHPNVIQSMEQRELLRVNHLDPVCPQGTCNPSIKAGDEESKEFIPIKLNSHHLCGKVIIANSHESPADPGPDDVPSPIGHQQHYGQDDIVDSFIAIESKATDLGRRGMETLGPSCNLEVGNQPHDHKMDGDRSHGEIEAFNSKRRRATSQSN